MSDDDLLDKNHYKRQRQFTILDEKDLHNGVVKWIRTYHNEVLMIAGLGELQDTSGKRINAWRKGSTKGTPDLMLFKRDLKIAIEFKTPNGSGRLSESQKEVLLKAQDMDFKVILSNDYDRIIYELSKLLNY